MIKTKTTFGRALEIRKYFDGATYITFDPLIYPYGNVSDYVQLWRGEPELNSWKWYSPGRHDCRFISLLRVDVEEILGMRLVPGEMVDLRASDPKATFRIVSC